MSDIIEGNLVNPSSVEIPGSQSPILGLNPFVYRRGESFKTYIKFPAGTKRLMYTISGRIFGSESIVFQQIVYPINGQAGTAEFFVDTATTSCLTPGMYWWDVFQLNDDGTRDLWSASNSGTFSITDSPSSSSITIASSGIVAPPTPPPCTPYDFTIIKGATWSQSLKWISAGSAVDLTGYSAALNAKVSISDSSSVFSLTTGNGEISLASDGTISLTLTSGQTAALTAGNYAYELFLTSPGSVVTRLLNGFLFVQF